MITTDNIRLTIPEGLKKRRNEGSRGNGKRLLVLGFDGMTFDIIHKLVKKGLMRNIQRLMEQGVWGELDCPPPTNSIVGWTSFMTGTNPGKHGIFNYGTLVEGKGVPRHEFVMSDATIRGVDPWWNLVPQGGKNIVVVNVIGTYPPDVQRGIQISGGSLLPLEYGSYTFPPELTPELEGYMYSAPFSLERAVGVDGRVDRVNEVFFVSKYLLRETNWDCFVAVFHEPDKTHSVEGEGPKLERIYNRIDEIVGDLISAAGPGVRVILCSDHGNGPYGKSVHVERWLYEKGWLRLRDSRESLKQVTRQNWIDEGIRGQLTHMLFKLLHRLRAAGITGRSLPFWGPRVKSWVEAKEREVDFDPIDWDGTRAYRTRVDGSSSNCGGIRLVDGGRDEESAREIVTGLLELRDPKSGEKIVDRVLGRDELYSGSLVERIPELILILKEGYGMARYAGNVDSIRDPCIVTEHSKVRYTHRRHGVVIMSGSGIRPGQLISPRIVDIAANALYLLGASIPSYMDGVVWKEAYEEEMLSYAPPVVVERDGCRFGAGDMDLSRARRMEKVNQKKLMKVIYQDR